MIPLSFISSVPVDSESAREPSADNEIPRLVPSRPVKRRAAVVQELSSDEERGSSYRSAASSRGMTPPTPTLHINVPPLTARSQQAASVRSATRPNISAPLATPRSLQAGRPPLPAVTHQQAPALPAPSINRSTAPERIFIPALPYNTKDTATVVEASPTVQRFYGLGREEKYGHYAQAGVGGAQAPPCAIA